MHHFKNALRSKKSKVELKPEDSAPEELPKAIPDEQSTLEVEVQYEVLATDPSRVIAVERAVSPASIIKGVTTAAAIAKDVAEVVDKVQDSGFVDKVGDILDKSDDENKPKDKKSPRENDVKDVSDVVDKLRDVLHDDDDSKSRPGASGKTSLPPAVAAHNARMRVKASSILPQEPPKDDPKASKNDENAPIDMPAPLAKALKHMDIVAARSKPPAAPQGPQGLNKHMRAVAAKPGAPADDKHKDKEEPELPPNLAKAMRSMQIVGARTPEGRALAAAAAGQSREPASPNTASKPQIKIRAATRMRDDEDGKQDEEKKSDEDLPPELKAHQRHMEIFAASHKSGGPGPVSRIARDPGLQTEHAADIPTKEAATQTATDAEPPASEPGAVPLTETDAAGKDDTPASLTPKAGANDPASVPKVMPSINTPVPTDKTMPAGVIAPTVDKPAPTDLTARLKTTPTVDNPAPTDPTAASKATPAAQPKLGANQTSGTKPATAADAKGPASPTANDIVRYRYHHGVNLGSVYVLEKWLTPSAFPPDAPEEESSELSCVSEWVKEIGLEATQKKFEERWSKALNEEDWKWLTSESSCTSIRLPIGHFTLGPDYCKGTPFEEFGAVYKNAWTAVKDFIKTAHENGIGVLIDLHALPGGANPGEHSGTNSGEAELWKNPANLELASKCVEFVAKDIKELDGIIGIQPCNEAVFDARGMYDWYDKVIAAVSAVDAKVPLYISDAWDLQEAVKYSKEQNKVDKKRNPLVVDTHVYFCFNDEDKALNPTQVVEKLLKCLSAIDRNEETSRSINLDDGASAVIVGEYSCALDPETWEKQDGGDLDAIKKSFGNKQGEYFSSKVGGAYFWTLKMDWMDGGDWGFVEQTKTSAILAPIWLSFTKEEVEGRTQNADSKAKSLKDAAVKTYAESTKSALGAKSDEATSRVHQQSNPNPKQDAKQQGSKQDAKPPGRVPPTKHTKQRIKQKATAQPSKPESTPFLSGWELGWNDARSFFRSRNEGDLPGVGADRIGLKELWVLKRLSECGLPADKRGELEHGIWKGIDDFESAALD